MRVSPAPAELQALGGPHTETHGLRRSSPHRQLSVQSWYHGGHDRWLEWRRRRALCGTRSQGQQRLLLRTHVAAVLLARHPRESCDTLFAVICWSHACWSKLVFICNHVCIFSTGSTFSPLPLQMKSALCPSALHHLARRPGKARSGLDLFLYLSRKPSFCPRFPWFLASPSRHPVNFHTGRCRASLLTCGTKNSIVSFECRCRL